MSEPQHPSSVRLSVEQLRKQAKERLVALRAVNPSAKLADAQFLLAHEHGFDTWPKFIDFASTMDPRASEPRIVAPVTRFLGARDKELAVRFWRDVLGFEVRGSVDGSGVELTSGRARVRLGEYDCPPDVSSEGRPPGSAVIFFDTDDIQRMHAAIRARGGQPTEIEKVNWIKRRVFEVRDPDGHVIWFGQSYHQRSPDRPRRMLSRVIPELPFDDVPAAVRHYRDVLGFAVNYQQEDLGVMDRDAARVLLVQRTPQHSGIGSAYFYVRDADGLYSELVGGGADVQGEPVSQRWGLREFSVHDLERNRLTFGQPFE